MFDPHLSRPCRITRDVARGMDSGDGGLQQGIDEDAVLHLQSRGLGELRARLHAHADDHEIGGDLFSGVQREALAVEGGRGGLQVHVDAMVAMQLRDAVAECAPEHALQRHLFARDDMHLQAAFA
jgi:hypothetical protein